MRIYQNLLITRTLRYSKCLIFKEKINNNVRSKFMVSDLSCKVVVSFFHVRLRFWSKIIWILVNFSVEKLFRVALVSHIIVTHTLFCVSGRRVSTGNFVWPPGHLLLPVCVFISCFLSLLIVRDAITPSSSSPKVVMWNYWQSEEKTYI